MCACIRACVCVHACVYVCMKNSTECMFLLHLIKESARMSCSKCHACLNICLTVQGSFLILKMDMLIHKILSFIYFCFRQ